MALVSFTGVSGYKPNAVDSFSLTAGKKLYATHCSGCHGASGQGGYGPNLCDAYWIHGKHYHNIHHSISHGITKKGMPAFKHSLKHSEVRDISHYIYISLKGTSPSNAKAAEGKKL